MTRKCKICREVFIPTKPVQTVCGFGCALTLSFSIRAKADKIAAVKDRRAIKELKESKLPFWNKKVEKIFNEFIRLRDFDQPCISCGRYHQGQWHAGHFLTVGAHPELRFEELNVNRQCQPCNTHLHGNVLKYRKSLLEKYGVEVVDWLEGPHPLNHYTVDDLKAKFTHYTAKAKQLKEAQA